MARLRVWCQVGGTNAISFREARRRASRLRVLLDRALDPLSLGLAATRLVPGLDRDPPFGLLPDELLIDYATDRPAEVDVDDVVSRLVEVARAVPCLLSARSEESIVGLLAEFDAFGLVRAEERSQESDSETPSTIDGDGRRGVTV